MKAIGEKDPRQRQFAVRVFRINENQQHVLTVYAPLFRALAGISSL
jgi:hypothetical protein